MAASALVFGTAMLAFSSPALGQIERRPLKPCNLPAPDVGVRGLRQTNLWTDGVVYYVFDSNVTSSERQTALDVMSTLESVCNVTFTPRTLSIQPYIHIRDSTENSSSVGVQGGRQYVNIFNWNFPFIIAHELMHALGIRHEQQRSDRNSYITVNTANIVSGKEHNFTIDTSATPTGPYDFDSVMHYDSYAFSSNGNPTIEIRSPYDAAHDPIGQRDHLSDGDMLTLQTMYGQTTTPTNDYCFQAIQILPGDHLHGSLRGATGDSSSFPACGLSDGNPSVWYRFVAPSAGMLELSTCGTNDSPGYDLGMDTVLDVWSTCLTTFANQLACNDDDVLDALCGPQAGADLDSGLTLALNDGDQVMIRVSHFFGAFSNGGFQINADFQMVNDDCDLATDVYAGDSIVGTLSGATNDGSASCGFSATQPDVWYRFTAPSSGTLLVNTCGTNDGPGVDRGMVSELGLHSACSSTGANELACNYFEYPQVQCAGLDGGRGYDSAIDYDMAPGESVLIRVSNTSGFLRDGRFVLNVDFAPGNCPCETDGDPAQVDVFDLLAYLDLWFAGSASAERTGNGTVDVFDLLAYLDCWFDASGGNPCL